MRFVEKNAKETHRKNEAKNKITGVNNGRMRGKEKVQKKEDKMKASNQEAIIKRYKFEIHDDLNIQQRV